MSNQENISETSGTQGLSSAGASARMSYAHARDAAQQAVEQARDRAAQYYEQGKAKAIDLEHKIEDSVRENPMRSVLIAAGAGLLLGMLLRRR